MTPQEKDWLATTVAAAKDAQHIWPEMAGCEAALESSWGESQLAKQDFNLFGTKQHSHPVYETVSLPTKEFLGGKWKVMSQDFVKYDNFQECFEDRMNTLKRLAPFYPHYRDALAASDAKSYVELVSLTWSTDLQRAAKCIKIYEEFFPSDANDDLQNHEPSQ